MRRTGASTQRSSAASVSSSSTMRPTNQPNSCWRKSPQLLLVGREADRHAERQRALAPLGSSSNWMARLSIATPLVAEGRVDQVALAVRQQRAEVRLEPDRGRRAPLVLLRADLGVEARARRGEPRIEGLRGRRVAAVGLRLGRGDQRHHLRVEQLLQRALGQRAKTGVEHHIMTPKNSASGTDTETSRRRLSECTAAVLPLRKTRRRAAARSGSRGRAESRWAAADRAGSSLRRSRPTSTSMTLLSRSKSWS